MSSDNKKDQVDEAGERKMIEFDETMRIIKEATGVSNIDEVLQKFASQKETNTHMLELRKQNEERFQQLKQKKIESLAQYEEFKLAGEAKRTHTRQMIAEFEQHLKDSEVQEQEAKIKYERTATVLGSIKAGVQHLADKLEGIQVRFRVVDCTNPNQRRRWQASTQCRTIPLWPFWTRARKS
jgi:methyl coenzyme M reductase beta subunit